MIKRFLETTYTTSSKWTKIKKKKAIIPETAQVSDM